MRHVRLISVFRQAQIRGSSWCYSYSLSLCAEALLFLKKRKKNRRARKNYSIQYHCTVDGGRLCCLWLNKNTLNPTHNKRHRTSVTTLQGTHRRVTNIRYCGWNALHCLIRYACKKQSVIYSCRCLNIDTYCQMSLQSISIWGSVGSCSFSHGWTFSLRQLCNYLICTSAHAHRQN